MKTVALSKGKVAIVDKESVHLLKGNKWVASYSGRKWYAVRGGHGCERTYMHRLLAGATKGMLVDHVNGDTLDNRKRNLRLCTQQENSFNSVARSPKSGYKGVSQFKKRWWARLMLNGKTVNSGSFLNPKDAAKEYDRLARHYFGKFARTNFNGNSQLAEK